MIFPQKNVLNGLSIVDFIIKTNLSNTKSEMVFLLLMTNSLKQHIFWRDRLAFGTAFVDGAVT